MPGQYVGNVPILFSIFSGIGFIIIDKHLGQLRERCKLTLFGPSKSKPSNAHYLSAFKIMRKRL
jgi:hypothetical protein